jgi:hypothetical protein
MLRGLWFACALASCVAHSGCSEAPPAGNFHLATVAASPEHGLLFVAQPGREAVDVLSIASTRFVARLVDPRRAHVLRLAVDHQRSRLWVADFRLLQAYALPGLEELRSYPRPQTAYHERFSDLVLDDAGNVFVLARGGARLYRIDARSLELERWLDLDHQAADAALLLANRALLSADQRYLFLPSPASGHLLRVDTRSKEAVTVAAGANLICGLLFRERDGAGIRAFDCAGGWEARIAGGAVLLRGQARPAGAITRF